MPTLAKAVHNLLAIELHLAILHDWNDMGEDDVLNLA